MSTASSTLPGEVLETGGEGGLAARSEAARTVLHIPALDGIRATAFLTVFFAHAGLGSFVPGYFGLNLFFFLSGYLITTLMRIEFEASSDVSFKQFYLRRAFRILPPFYLVLIVAYAVTLSGAVEGDVGIGGALAQILHVTNYYIVYHGWWEGLAPGTWVYWSLAVEEHFYLVFPLMFLWSRRRFGGGRAQAMLLLWVCLAVLVWRCVLIFGFEAIKERTYVATDTRIDSILAGCILAVWRNPIYPGERMDDRRLLWLWLPVGFVAVVVSLIVRVHWFDQTLRYTLQSFGLMPFFMAAIRWHDRFPFRLLDSRVMTTIGLYSYSLYLMHTFALWFCEHWIPLPELVRGLLTLAVLMGVAALIHRYVEKPAGTLRKRVSKRMAMAA